MTTVYVTLPASLEIDGTMHVAEFRTHNFIVLQNYSAERATSNQPLLDRTPQVVGANWFHVYRVIQNEPAGESLGEWLATFTDLQPAIDFIATQEQLA